MSERITLRMIKSKIDYLNKLVPGKNYGLDNAYGGFKLESNGSRNVLPTGYCSKTRLFFAIDCMIQGIKEAQDE